VATVDATIETRSLSMRYGTTVAVDDLSIAVRPGRVTGFVGPNDAGKTTTMQLSRTKPVDERAPSRSACARKLASNLHLGGTRVRSHLATECGAAAFTTPPG